MITNSQPVSKRRSSAEKKCRQLEKTTGTIETFGRTYFKPYVDVFQHILLTQEQKKKRNTYLIHLLI
jgi:hypothetical protein